MDSTQTKNKEELDEIALDLGDHKFKRNLPLMNEVKKLSELNIFKSSLACFTQWFVIVSVFILAGLVNHWAVYILSMLIIATRQHALFVLAHEGAHYRLFTNKKINNIIGELFLAYPFGISMWFFRRIHFGHHRYVNSERDPELIINRDCEDWKWPKSQLECFKVFLRGLIFNPQSIRRAIQFTPWSKFKGRKVDKIRLPFFERSLFLIFICTIFLFMFLTNSWLKVILLWVVPLVIFVPWILRIRSLAEHYCLENTKELNRTRTVIPTFLERMLISPCNINYHIEHHLFPSVPFYNLPKLHKLLDKNKQFTKEAHITCTYTDLMKGVLSEVCLTGIDLKKKK